MMKLIAECDRCKKIDHIKYSFKDVIYYFAFSPCEPTLFPSCLRDWNEINGKLLCKQCNTDRINYMKRFK
jgi:hypothetical protein